MATITYKNVMVAYVMFMDDFSKPKIMYSEIVQSPQFYLDKNGEFYPEATCFLLTGKDLEYLYRVVHSQIVTFVFKAFYAGGGLGDHGYRYKKAFFEKLPIPIWIGNNVQKEIMRTSIQTDIDSLIMQLYGLSIDEFHFIESQ